MKLNKITPNIFHLTFKAQKDMAKTMLRFQEHYESPKFRGEIFSLAEFKKWYRTTQKHGKFSYYQDWAGFNVPGYVFKPFLAGYFKYLTTREKRVLKIIKGYNFEQLYLIATAKDCEALRHETAHGLFYTKPRYKKQVLKVLESCNLVKLKKHLIKMGYCKEVLDDECHAYLLDEAENFYKQMNIPNGLTVQKKLQKLYYNELS